MTIIKCPHGCGGVFSNDHASCPACRRYVNSTSIVIPEDLFKVSIDEDGIDEIYPGYEDCDIMLAHRVSWCWEWFGPPHHRMKCRLPKGHPEDHDTHNLECTERMLTSNFTPRVLELVE